MAKAEKTTDTTVQSEVITVKHEGVDVHVLVDYVQMTTSLVELSGNEWIPKRWVFSHRGYSYMKAWQRIVEAMGMAMSLAETKLKEREDEKAQRATEALIALKERDCNNPQYS